MLRKAAVMLALTVVGLVALPTLAFAYPAPPVTPGGSPSPVVTTTTTTELASTGAGFSVGTAVAIGAVILIVGLALVLVGNRLRKSNG